MSSKTECDVAVVGAGVFGAWIAYTLQKAGQSTLLLDHYGPGNPLASSGDDSRLTRCSYGPDEIYSRWSWESLRLWKDFQAEIGEPIFFHTGMLWMSRKPEKYMQASARSLTKLRIPFE